MTHKELLKRIGMEIKVSRIRKGLHRKDVSRMTGLGLSTILKIENGMVDGGILTYKRISDALEVELKDFL